MSLSYYALELCNCSLRDYVTNQQVRNEHERWMPAEKQCLRQMADGLHYLHDREIIHGAIKPTNVLIKVAVSAVLKLADGGFGTAIQSNSISGGMSGSLIWWPTEIQTALDQGRDGDAVLTSETDIFSLGCVYFYFTSGGKHPFGTLSSIAHNIIAANAVNMKAGMCLFCLINELTHPVMLMNYSDQVCLQEAG